MSSQRNLDISSDLDLVTISDVWEREHVELGSECPTLDKKSQQAAAAGQAMVCMAKDNFCQGLDHIRSHCQPVAQISCVCPFLQSVRFPWPRPDDFIMGQQQHELFPVQILSQQ